MQALRSVTLRLDHPGISRFKRDDLQRLLEREDRPGVILHGEGISGFQRLQSWELLRNREVQIPVMTPEQAGSALQSLPSFLNWSWEVWLTTWGEAQRRWLRELAEKKPVHSIVFSPSPRKMQELMRHLQESTPDAPWSFRFEPLSRCHPRSWSCQAIAGEVRRWKNHPLLPRPFFQSDNRVHSIPAEWMLPPDAKTFWKRDENPAALSVVIPTYNNGPFLPSVLRGLSMQKNAPPFEVIVVDDASEDGTQAFLERWFLGHDHGLQGRALRIDQPHRWPGPDFQFRAGTVRNLGARFARAEKILFLDGDILVDEDFLARQFRHLQEHDLVQSVRWYHRLESPYEALDPRRVFQEGKIWIDEADYRRDFYQTPDWNGMKFPWKHVCSYALGVHRQHWKKLGGFREVFFDYGFEDVELGHRWHSEGLDFFLDQKPVLHLVDGNDRRAGFWKRLQRQATLAKTAKVLFHNTYDPDLIDDMPLYFRDEWWSFGR